MSHTILKNRIVILSKGIIMKKHIALLTMLLTSGVLLADTSKYNRLLNAITEQDYSQVAQTLLEEEPISTEQLDELIEEAKAIEASLRKKATLNRWGAFSAGLATCGLIWKFVPGAPAPRGGEPRPLIPLLGLGSALLIIFGQKETGQSFRDNEAGPHIPFRRHYKAQHHSQEGDFKELMLIGSLGISLYGLLRDWAGNVRKAKQIVTKLVKEKKVLERLPYISHKNF